MQSSAGGGCGLRRFLAEPQYNDRAAACGAHAKFGYELRASAAERLRPADRFAIEKTREIENGRQLAKRPRTSGRKGGRELRAFAERSCGPLRLLTGTAHEE